MVHTPDDGFAFSVALNPGIYRLTIEADAAAFDWNSLYYAFHMFDNNGQMTGPWDFDMRDRNRPLLPSYWVSRDAERIGLWYFARPSVSDVQNRRLRGRLCFLIQEPGEHRFAFAPYRESRLEFVQMLFEREPEDMFVPLELNGKDPLEANHAWTYRSDEPWAAMREGLQTTHREHVAQLDRALAWLSRHTDVPIAQVSLGTAALTTLIAKFRLTGEKQYLDSALLSIEKQLSRPAWGHQSEDGYGHEGDMTAAHDLRTIGIACNWLHEDLGDLEPRMLEAMREHGNRFLHNALLMKDYWGGSMLQDHGWRANAMFAGAAFTMLGRLPEAETWLAFIVPRIRKHVAAMPQDGVIARTSFGSLGHYLDDLTIARDGLVHATGEDLFDEPVFGRIMDFLWRHAEPDPEHFRGALKHGRGVTFIGGGAFLSRMASKHNDGRPAAIAAMIRKPLPDSMSGVAHRMTHFAAVFDLLAYDPAVAPVPIDGAPDGLEWYEDSGIVSYRNAETGLSFGSHCSAGIVSYTGYRRTTCPCDRIASNPTAGHFWLAINHEPILIHAAGAYRLSTALGNCMLVAGQGQYGDIGYPMSISQWTHRGEQIETAQWDAASDRGQVRLNLAPAYPREAEILSYTRDFLFFAGEQRLVCRDNVVLAAPKELCWLFHASSSSCIEPVDDHAYEINSEHATIRVAAHGIPRPKADGIHPTDVVWSYGGERPSSRHLRFTTDSVVSQAVVEFEVTW